MSYLDNIKKLCVESEDWANLKGKTILKIWSAEKNKKRNMAKENRLLFEFSDGTAFEVGSRRMEEWLYCGEFDSFGANVGGAAAMEEE